MQNNKEILTLMMDKARKSHRSQEEKIRNLTCKLAEACLLMERCEKIYKHGELYAEQAQDHQQDVRKFLNSIYDLGLSETQKAETSA